MRPSSASLVSLIPLLALLACGGEPPRAEGPPARRLVLITVDTLRADAIEGERPAMPRLAARADAAARFVDSWTSTSTTQPTHASLFPGKHPWEHGVVRNGMPLAPEQLTLAEQLGEAGWQTSAVVASFPLARRYGLDQGFEVYVDEFTRGDKQTWND